VSAQTVAPAASVGAAGLDLGNGITVERVRVAVERVKLERHGNPEVEAEVGPFLADLSGAALAGSVQQVFDGDVPAGSYDEIEVRVAPVAALAELGGRSVVVEGTIDGAPFSFGSALHAEQKREVSTPVTVGGGSANVTLSFDVTAWFTGPGGARLDPRREADRSAIEGKLAASIDAFEDGDRHGRDGGGDDHGGPGGGGGGDDAPGHG
jgi:hypothetical protein